MTPSRLTVSAGALAMFVVAGMAIGESQAPQTQKPAAPVLPPLLHSQNLRMLPDDPVKTNNNRVFGNSNNPGNYITRNRFGPNQTSRPHYHTMDRWVTVMKGTWYTGEGKVFRPKTMVPIPQGGVMFHPAYFIHYDGSQDGEEVIVHIQGYGPVVTVQVEEDEQGNPVNRGGEGAGYAVSPPGAKPAAPQK